MRLDPGSGGDATIGEIVEAAIDADLQHRGWQPGGSGRLVRKIGLNETITVTLSTATGALEAVPGPGAGTPEELAFQELVAEVEHVYEIWPPMVDLAFEQWTDLPSPGAPNAYVAQLEHAEKELRTGAVGPSSKGTGATPMSVGNSRLEADLENLRLYSADLRGRYAVEFATRYVTPLPGTIQSLGCLVASLCLSCTMQARIWEMAAADLAEVKQKALAAMKASAPSSGGGGGGLTAVLSVVGAVAGFAAAVPTMGASVAGTLGVLSASLGLAGAVKGLDASGGEKSVELGASTPHLVLSNMRWALVALDQAIRGQEEQLAAFLQQTLEATAGTYRGDFDLQARLNDRQDPGDVLDESTGVVVDANIIARITNLWLPTIAGDLRSARSDLTVGADAFARSGEIGLLPHGAWPDFGRLQDRTIDLLSNMARELDDGADALDAAARTIGLQDEQEARTFDREAERINNRDLNTPQ